MYGQVSDVLQAQSFIIRNEQVIDESANGVLSYRVADGTRVAQAALIADVFSTEEDAWPSAPSSSWTRKSPTRRRCPSRRTTLWPTPPCWADQIYSAMEDVALGVNPKRYFSQRPPGRSPFSAP